MRYQPLLAANLVTLIESVAAHTGRSATSISREVARDDRFYGTVKAGANFTVGKYDTVAAKLKSIWPDDLEWPDDIPAPDPDAASMKGDRNGG